MSLFEIIQIIQILVFVVGISGVGYWGRKWFKSLQGAVDAQRTTIEAQKALTETMVMHLSIADAPKMAERYTAYKKILDEEQEAKLKKYEDEKKGFLEGLEERDVGLRNLLTIVRGMIPYVPRNKRREIISSVDLAPQELKDLKSIAETAPDLVAEENSKREELLIRAQKESEELQKVAIETLRRELDAWKNKELENEILKLLPRSDDKRGMHMLDIGFRLKNKNDKAIGAALNHLEEQGLVFRTKRPHPDIPTWRLSPNLNISPK